MPFFLNPFTQDFEGNLLLGDRKHIPKFVAERNSGRGDEQVTVHTEPTYDLSGNDSDGNSKEVLTLVFALNDRKNWSELPITISGSSLSAITAVEVVTSLQANAIFAGFFKAHLEKFPSKQDRVVIKQQKAITQFWFYIKPGRAESVLQFNKFAGVGELPTYFSRHTMANRHTYSDCQNMLIQLDTGLNVDSAIITNGGFNPSSPKADYELLDGRSGLFIFTKNAYSGSNLVTKIEYHAGAGVGDFAKKTTYGYSGSSVIQVCEVPYILTSGDLVTP